MSKSLGNFIGVEEEAHVIFKKVMEVPDELIIRYFELATDVHPDKIEEIKRELENGKNPRDVKYELANAITSLLISSVKVAFSFRKYSLIGGALILHSDAMLE